MRCLWWRCVHSFATISISSLSDAPRYRKWRFWLQSSSLNLTDLRTCKRDHTVRFCLNLMQWFFFKSICNPMQIFKWILCSAICACKHGKITHKQKVHIYAHFSPLYDFFSNLDQKKNFSWGFLVWLTNFLMLKFCLLFPLWCIHVCNLCTHQCTFKNASSSF